MAKPVIVLVPFQMFVQTKCLQTSLNGVAALHGGDRGIAVTTAGSVLLWFDRNLPSYFVVVVVWWLGYHGIW
ncbi:unnamed protein product [Laminaria digitata]